MEEPLDLPLTASSNSFSLDLARGVNVRASVERQSHKTREARAVAEKKRESLPFLVSPRLVPSVTRVVIFVSRALLDELRKTKDCSKSLQCVYTFSCLARFSRRTIRKTTAQSLYSAFTHFRVSCVLLDELGKKSPYRCVYPSCKVGRYQSYLQSMWSLVTLTCGYCKISGDD